jgi:acyl-CoA thioesterase YciA
MEGAEVEDRKCRPDNMDAGFSPLNAMPQDPIPAQHKPGDRELVLRVMPMPADSNANGDIFGGWIMAQVDIAGSILPARLSRGRITTVAVNEFTFKQPVSIGDLLSFYATITRVGRTSVTVHVEVFAERDPENLHIVKVTEANLTYVAIDRDGKPRLINPAQDTPA